MAAQIFFLDANVFLECRALEELPWKELTDEDPIRLLVALTVIEEIDKRKHGNDRRADRARKASQRLRGMCDAAISGHGNGKSTHTSTAARPFQSSASARSVAVAESERDQSVFHRAIFRPDSARSARSMDPQHGKIHARDQKGASVSTSRKSRLQGLIRQTPMYRNGKELCQKRDEDPVVQVQIHQKERPADSEYDHR